MKLNEVNGQVIIHRDSQDIINVNESVDGLSEFNVSEQAASELRGKYKGGDYWSLTIGTWNDKFPQEYEWEIEDSRGIIRIPILKGIVKYENSLPILVLYSERDF